MIFSYLFTEKKKRFAGEMNGTRNEKKKKTVQEDESHKWRTYKPRMVTKKLSSESDIYRPAALPHQSTLYTSPSKSSTTPQLNFPLPVRVGQSETTNDDDRSIPYHGVLYRTFGMRELGIF